MVTSRLRWGHLCCPMHLCSLIRPSQLSQFLWSLWKRLQVGSKSPQAQSALALAPTGFALMLSGVMYN